MQSEVFFKDAKQYALTAIKHETSSFSKRFKAWIP